MCPISVWCDISVTWCHFPVLQKAGLLSINQVETSDWGLRAAFRIYMENGGMEIGAYFRQTCLKSSSKFTPGLQAPGVTVVLVQEVTACSPCSRVTLWKCCCSDLGTTSKHLWFELASDCAVEITGSRVDHLHLKQVQKVTTIQLLCDCEHWAPVPFPSVH